MSDTATRHACYSKSVRAGSLWESLNGESSGTAFVFFFFPSSHLDQSSGMVRLKTMQIKHQWKHVNSSSPFKQISHICVVFSLTSFSLSHTSSSISFWQWEGKHLSDHIILTSLPSPTDPLCLLSHNLVCHDTLLPTFHRTHRHTAETVRKRGLVGCTNISNSGKYLGLE